MTKFVACAACVGPIPESLGALNKLEELSLSGNMLTGEKESNGLMLLLLEDVPLPCIPGTRSHNVFSRSTEIADATAFQAMTHVGSILNELRALTKIEMLIRASKRRGMRLLNASPLSRVSGVGVVLESDVGFVLADTVSRVCHGTIHKPIPSNLGDLSAVTQLKP